MDIYQTIWVKAFNLKLASFFPSNLMVFDFHGRVVVASLGGWENLSALLMSHIHKVLLLFRILSDKGVWCWKTIKVQIDAQKMGKVTFTRPAAQNGVFKCWSKDAGAHFGKVPSQWSVKVGATFNKWKFYFICTATSSPATTSDAFQENSKSTTFEKFHRIENSRVLLWTKSFLRADGR